MARFFVFPVALFYRAAIGIFPFGFYELTKENFGDDVKAAQKELASFHTETRNRQAELIVPPKNREKKMKREKKYRFSI